MPRNLQTGRVRFYRDSRGLWRWKAISRNGKKVARCAEGDGFTTLKAAKWNFDLLKKVAKWPIETVP